MLTIWLSVCAFTMLAALADATCRTVTVDSAGYELSGTFRVD
jgi:hypothetical protein